MEGSGTRIARLSAELEQGNGEEFWARITVVEFGVGFQ